MVDAIAADDSAAIASIKEYAAEAVKHIELPCRDAAGFMANYANWRAGRNDHHNYDWCSPTRVDENGVEWIMLPIRRPIVKEKQGG